MESPKAPVMHYEIPLDGVIIDTTVSPQTINLHLHGIKICIPITDEINEQLKSFPRNFRLLLEII